MLDHFRSDAPSPSVDGPWYFSGTHLTRLVTFEDTSPSLLWQLPSQNQVVLVTQTCWVGWSTYFVAPCFGVQGLPGDKRECKWNGAGSVLTGEGEVNHFLGLNDVWCTRVVKVARCAMRMTIFVSQHQIAFIAQW